MHKAILPMVLLLGCGSQVVRDPDVYKAEITFFADLATKQATALKTMIQKDCCKDGHLNPECIAAADLVVVTEARVGYHKDMALYNAGILEAKPGEAPVIPEAATVCKN